MPEGHSIHRLARQFTSVFGGAQLAVSSPQGRFAAGARLLDGHVLTSARAHGKQLFLHFDSELILRVHLGLYGAWNFGGDASFTGASSIGAPRRVGEREVPGQEGMDAERSYIGPPEPVGAVRARLVSDHGWADLRGPTACEVITEAERAVVVSKLGPDPLRTESDPADFVDRLRRSRSPVALLLMNQAVIAGVGNVYRAEVLFRQHINPFAPGSAFDGGQAAGLWADLVSIMGDGVRDGRIITTTADRRSGGNGAVLSSEAHYVYKRASLPCRVCETPIVMVELGARKLYWCPECQSD